VVAALSYQFLSFQLLDEILLLTVENCALIES